MAGIKLTEMERHLLFYAKGYYKKSEISTNDLKIIIGHFLGVKPALVSFPAIIYFLHGLHTKLYSKGKQKIFWADFIKSITDPCSHRFDNLEIIITDYTTGSDHNIIRGINIKPIFIDFVATLFIKLFLADIALVKYDNPEKPDPKILPLTETE